MKKIRLFGLICFLILTFLFLINFVHSQGQATVELGILPYADIDNDRIPDTIDTLIGNLSQGERYNITFNMTINGSINLSQTFNRTLEVVFKDADAILINFSWNFSEKNLYLQNVTIKKQIIKNRGGILVRGVNLTSGRTKTMYVENLNASLDILCIKDAEIHNLSEISNQCKELNETKILCDGSGAGSYNCTKVENGTRFKVTGLNFSGIQQRDGRGPTVNLVQPRQNAGNKNKNATFIYTVADASPVDNCSLFINDKLNMTNNSITKGPQTNFKLDNLLIGSYNWSINCTDNAGNVGDSAVRTISVLLSNRFNGTNLSAVDIRNVTNFVVEITGFGKINFSQDLDLSQGFDLDTYVTISSNRIELNSTALSSLNKSATLTLTGLSFSNPRILRDAAVCPSDICTKVSYSGGTLIFNVTQFTAYSSEEIPTEAAPSGGGGGGGGGPAPPIVTDFSIDKSSLKIVLKQGQTKTETLSIKNTGTTLFDVTAFLHEIAQFKLSPESNEVSTTLAPNEEKTIELVFKALENEKPDIYPAKIALKSPSTQKEIPTIIEVDSAEPLFDVDVEVLSVSKKVFPGNEVLLEVNLFNVRGFGRVDVVVEYAVKDLQGNLIASEHETLAVETQSKFTRSLTIPTSLRPGNYVAFAKVTYADSVGTSSDLFEVTAKTIRLYPIQIKDYRTILIAAIGIVILTAIVIFSVRSGYLRKKAPKTKTEEAKQLQTEDKSQKLRKELEALEAAHTSGLISEVSYQKSRERIQSKLSRLK